MAKIEITIPDDKAQEYLDTLAKRFGYRDEVFEGPDLVPNPVSKAGHVKANIVEFLKMNYREQKANEAVLQNSDALFDLS